MLSLNESLKGKTAWITGASRGIGIEIARRLAVGSVKLALSSSSKDSMIPLVTEFSGNNNTFFFPCDLKDSDAISSVYQKINQAIGVPDILINNAGISRFAPMKDLTLEDYDNIMAVNLRGPFLTMKALINGMIERNSGIIININSVSAKKTFTNSTVYAASKAGLLAMTRSLREEVRQYGIKVIDVFPGATDTDIWSLKAREKYSHKMMKPGDVADSIISILELALNERLMPEEIIIRPTWGDL
jgi:3-oxoacyl-[acyl-carrier protein] reductase